MCRPPRWTITVWTKRPAKTCRKVDGQAHLVEAFYDGSLREIEHDEVAEGFRIYYEQLKVEWEEPEEVLWQLEMYVLGNERQHPKVHRAAWVVLAHFFDRCDIFEVPPPGWTSHTLEASA